MIYNLPRICASRQPDASCASAGNLAASSTTARRTRATLRWILLGLATIGSVEAAEPSGQELDNFVTAMRQACLRRPAEESHDCLDRVRSATYIEGTVDLKGVRLLQPEALVVHRLGACAAEWKHCR